MARAALSWSRTELADKAKIGVATVVRFEEGKNVTTEKAGAMQTTLVDAGVEFIAAGAIITQGNGSAGVGVRLRQ